MNRPSTPAPAAFISPLVRRLVLGTALFLGLAVALAPRAPPVHAQEPKSPAVTAPAAPAAAAADSAAPVEGTEPEAPGKRGAKPRKHARVVIDGLGTDREFESFDEFVNNEPALFAMVVAVVAVVFFAPVLAIALILWYRMRKARMQNETILKLAEKGIVPSAEALDALSSGKPAPAAAPYYEQAKQIQRRAAWSDLRKGVLMAGFGIALSMYSLLSDQEPNGLGLVLLFVGLGFVVLWWFEQRHLAPAETARREAAPAAGAGTPSGSPPSA